MALDLTTELEAVIAALDAAGVPFAICGGIAVTIHGAPRLTQDLDLLVPADVVAAAKTAVTAVGFDVPAAPMVFGRGTDRERTVHGIGKMDGAAMLTLDFILAIAMKRIAGRPKDPLDIATLEGEGDGEA